MKLNPLTAKRFRLTVLFAWTPFLATLQIAEAVEKTEHMVAMADGVSLATDVYLPSVDGGPYPAIYSSGPYGKGGNATTVMASYFCSHGYAFVSQDVRGRGKSEGHHAIIFHHSGWAGHRDGHSSIDWIASQPWCDGHVGTIGVSALGITQNMQAVAAPAALKAHIPEVACSNLFSQTAYQGGVWRSALMEGWLKSNGLDDVNLPSFLEHYKYDKFWAELNPEAQASRVQSAGMFIGGWYDIFLQGTINAFVSTQRQGMEGAKGRCRMIVGPWAHGVFDELKYPDADFFAKVTFDDRRRFLDRHLKGEQNGVDDEPAVKYYVMGDPSDEDAPGNFWRVADDWPPTNEPLKLFLQHDGALANEPADLSEAKVQYLYDPADPIPTVGGQNLILPKGPMDQRSVESRPDVKLFTSEPLDEPLEITGRITAKLFISSDAPDTDFAVKLCDVYPDGRSMLVTDGIQRARFRESFESESLLEPGKVYEIDVDLWSTSLIFNRGHRIRIAVSSSNSPRFEPNPNTGDPHPIAGESRVAKNTIYVSSDRASHVILPRYAGPADWTASEGVAE